jgi:hypothetical protein
VSYTRLISRKDQFKHVHRLALHCNMFTTKGQIGSFIQRALFDGHKIQYYVFDLDLLSMSNLNYFMQQIDVLMKLKVTDNIEDRASRTVRKSKKIERALDINKNLVVFVRKSPTSNVIRDSSFFKLISDSDINYNQSESSSKPYI